MEFCGLSAVRSCMICPHVRRPYDMSCGRFYTEQKICGSKLDINNSIVHCNIVVLLVSLWKRGLLTGCVLYVRDVHSGIFFLTLLAFFDCCGFTLFFQFLVSLLPLSLQGIACCLLIEAFN